MFLFGSVTLFGVEKRGLIGAKRVSFVLVGFFYYTPVKVEVEAGDVMDIYIVQFGALY